MHRRKRNNSGKRINFNLGEERKTCKNNQCRKKIKVKVGNKEKNAIRVICHCCNFLNVFRIKIR